MQLRLALAEAGLSLCPKVDICVQDLNQCPDRRPSSSDIFVFQEEIFCPLPGAMLRIDIALRGIASGPVGTEISFNSTNIPTGEFDFESFGCKSWTGCRQ